MLNVTRYQLRDNRNAVLIFYAIVLSLIAMITFSLRNASGEVQAGGFGFSTMIFIFILGLNCFRSSFKFTQANGISRRRFYLANILALLTIAVVMALVDLALGLIIGQFVPYEGMMEQLYRTPSLGADLIWSFALYLFAAQLGWLISMIYYRSGKLQKTLVSLSPVFGLTLLAYFDQRTQGAVLRAIVNFLGTVFGLNGVPNPFIGVVTFLLSATGIAGLSYLLIRRMPIKG